MRRYGKNEFARPCLWRCRVRFCDREWSFALFASGAVLRQNRKTRIGSVDEARLVKVRTSEWRITTRELRIARRSGFYTHRDCVPSKVSSEVDHEVVSAASLAKIRGNRYAPAIARRPNRHSRREFESLTHSERAKSTINRASVRAMFLPSRRAVKCHGGRLPILRGNVRSKSETRYAKWNSKWFAEWRQLIFSSDRPSLQSALSTRIRASYSLRTSKIRD